MLKYFEDFETGAVFKSRARSITEADIVSFAALSGDWHPLHTDIEYARKGPFGERIAHGFLVLSVVSGLMELDKKAIIAFYGMDKLRFIGATKIGDTIHVEMEVVEHKEKDAARGLVTFQSVIKNQKGEDLVVFHMHLLLEKFKK